MNPLHHSTRPLRVFQVVVLIMSLLVTFGVVPAQSAVPHLGYGFNVAEWDVTRMLNMGFDWIKIFHSSNPTGLPAATNVLYRFLAKDSDLSNISAFGDDVAEVASAFGTSIDAYEIGNEVNIDNPDYGWGAPVNAADYKLLLCEAYARIKTADPTAVVVSAGLAPTGRVTGDWNGHPGHNGQYQDEREYLTELLTAGGGACLDAVGYHPYGYLADYDVAPDVVTPGVDPLQDPRSCPNGFCFRGAEKIYEIMQIHGLGGKKVWATEFGWITQPPDHCLNDPSWGGRQWQIVSEEKQAANLVGAFQYADANWPWMGAMFVFNLNFNVAPWYTNPCEQMLFYSIQGRAAESALAAMPKNKASLNGRLRTETTQLTWLIDVDQQPVDLAGSVDIANWGWGTVVYTATVDSSADIAPVIANPTGSLSPTAQAWVNFDLPGFDRSLGTYTGTLTVDWFAAGAGNNPRVVDLEVRVVPDVQRVFLPAIVR